MQDGGGGNRTLGPDSASGLAGNDLQDQHDDAAANVLHFCGSGCRRASQHDAKLSRIIEMWPSLAEHLKLAVFAIIEAGSIRPVADEVADD